MLQRMCWGIAVVFILCVSPAVGEQAPAGNWQSVDIVRNVADFTPGKKSFNGTLSLKEFQCSATGTASMGWSCVDGWTTHRDGKTRHRYFLKQMDGAEYLFLPWLSGDVTIRGQKPFYYVLKKVADISVKEFDNVRWKDLSQLDLSKQFGLIATLWFNEKTLWPKAIQRRGGCDPRQLLVLGMNPGLGVRELHQQGITGKGVNVAIIDQPLHQNHPEFAGKIAAYHDVGCGSKSSMHGPAVASLLVGSHCGTAPGAKVYYVAAPSWTKDTAYQAKALDWIIDQNKNLSPSEKIRVVSVSAAPSGPGSPFDKNRQMWDKACARAESADLMVLDCTQHRGIIGPCYYDLADPNNLAKCKAGFPGMPGRASSDRLLVPCSPRTTAEEYKQGDHAYQYCGRGGLSWSIPYCAGVLALGWQLRPDLTASQMQECLFQSAFITSNGAKIINPKKFIAKIKTIPKRIS